MQKRIFEFIVVVVIIISTVVLVHIYTTYQINNQKTPFINKVNNKTVSIDEYGITLNNYHVSRKKIKFNQHLSTILSFHNINSFKNEDIIRKTRAIFDLRYFKAGNYYSVYSTKDSLNELKYFIYEHSKTEFIKISLLDSIKVDKVIRQIDTIQKSGIGTINSSLWESMLENNINPTLAIELSEIYAWTIDFFGLTKGDKYKVIYDELYIDSASIGIGKIYSAIFTHNQKEYRAFLFYQDGKEGYYDENGQSLKKAFLKAPLKFNRISSKFSYSRYHPILKIRRPHRGVDYAAPTGTPIYSIGDGKVIAKGYTKSAGYYIKIKHNGTYTSGYNHLSRYAKGMKVGKSINQGQLIGYVGSTGYATGPHLDFRIWKNGHLTDPLKIKAPPIEPVNDENLINFNKVRNVLTSLLDLI